MDRQEIYSRLHQVQREIEELFDGAIAAAHRRAKQKTIGSDDPWSHGFDTDMFLLDRALVVHQGGVFGAGFASEEIAIQDCCLEPEEKLQVVYILEHFMADFTDEMVNDSR